MKPTPVSLVSHVDAGSNLGNPAPQPAPRLWPGRAVGDPDSVPGFLQAAGRRVSQMQPQLAFPCPPLTGKDLMLQMTTFFSGTYLALPTLVLKRGESASLGTGTEISTLLATDCFLNWPLACPARDVGNG